MCVKGPGYDFVVTCGGDARLASPLEKIAAEVYFYLMY